MTEKYIRLDDVMTIIARKHLFKDKTDFDKCVHAIAEQIKALDTIEVEPQEWISVKDSRKPKMRERVWVTDCDGEVWIMYYNECDSYFSEFGDVFADDIIAWQPITEPSPYKRDAE